MVKLLVADAQCIVRMGMKQLCRDMGDFSVEGEAANGEEVLAALSAVNFDMMVLDPGLPGQRRTNGRDAGGANLINTIRTRYASLPILMFATNNDPQTFLRILRKGVSGFMSKSNDLETLATAMRKVSIGESFISHDIAITMMLEDNRGQDIVLRESLTPREFQVLNLLGKGWNLSAIAKELFISSRTVSTYKTRLMQKMNFKSNAELFHYALECAKADSKRQGVQGGASVHGESGWGDREASGLNEAVSVAGQMEAGLPAHHDCSASEPDLMGGA